MDKSSFTLFMFLVIAFLLVSLLVTGCDGYAEETTPTPEPYPTSAPSGGLCFYLDRWGNIQQLDEGRCK